MLYALSLTQYFIDNTFIATDTTYDIYVNVTQSGTNSTGNWSTYKIPE